MSPKSVTIVGAGQAALQLAASLRQKKYEGAITLIGDEPYLPYSRPPLSKGFLKGTTEVKDLYFRQDDWFETANVSVRLGQRVEALDRANKTLQIAGEAVPYDTLVFATGTRPRLLPNLPPSLENVVYLRGIDDVKKVMALVPESSNAVVIGGGFIGLEFAAVARGLGLNVTVFEAGERLMMRAVSPAISKWFLDLHARHGADIALAEQIADVHIEGNRVKTVTTCNGDALQVDLIVVGIGVIPNDDLARQAGLATENGITVSETLRTADLDIFAIGDCCNFPFADGRRVRLESVQNAVDQAKHLAGTLTGEDEPYRTVPWFWSDQYDVKLQIAGLLSQDMQTSSTPGDDKYSLDHHRDAQLTCVESVNDLRAHLAARKAISLG